MNKIKGNNYIRNREKPEKRTKHKIINSGAAHLTKTEKKKLYDYYICDFCGDEIKIGGKWEEKTGEIVTLPPSLTHEIVTYKLALCNKCVKSVIKEFEEDKR